MEIKKPKKLSLGRQSKHVLTVLGLTVGVLALAWLWLIPQYSNLRTALADQQAIKGELNSVNSELEEVNKLAQSVDAMPAETQERIDRSLPVREDLEELLATMHKLSEQSSLLITNLDIKGVSEAAAAGSVVGTGEIKKSQINIVLTGSYSNFMTFLQLIERHIRLIDVKETRIQNPAFFSGGASDQSNNLQITLTANVYHLKDIPSSPTFPYGKDITTTLLEDPRFKSLQSAVTPIPIGQETQNNPFAPIR